jgi:uncharacterized protein
MRLDLTRVQGPREHVERSYPAEALDTREDDFRVSREIALALDVEPKSPGYRLVGRVASELELPCSRCLEPFRWPVEAAFDLLYLPASANTGEGEREVGADELNAAFYHDDAVDLAQLVREQFYLSLPMKPLCRDDCKGLCPVCGANHNHGPCSCDTRWEDPRLAQLKGLLGERPARGDVKS